MEQKTIFFNTDLGSNGRRTTCKGGVDIVRYENGTTDLFIHGPKGGLRHVVMLPDSAAEALRLGQELMALCSQG